MLHVLDTLVIFDATADFMRASSADVLETGAALCLLALLFAAAFEFRRFDERRPAPLVAPLALCASLGALLGGVCLVLVLVFPGGEGLRRGGQMLLQGFASLMQTFLFLGGALLLEQRGGPRVFAWFGRRRGATLALHEAPRVQRPHPALPAILCLRDLAVMLAFSWCWVQFAVWTFDARAADRLVERMTPGPEESGAALLLTNYVLMALAPVFEEIALRGYVQGKIQTLLRGARAPAFLRAAAPVVLPAALWALLHGGMMDPSWVKWVQIFGLGVLLGMARRRRGLEYCILLHFLFNHAGFLTPIISAPAVFGPSGP